MNVFEGVVLNIEWEPKRLWAKQEINLINRGVYLLLYRKCIKACTS